MNRITLIGHLGRDPEMRYLPDGQAVTSFSLATSYGKGDREKTTWFNCSAWDKQAELANEYLKKGQQVYVEGRVSLHEYEGRDGQQRASLDVAVTNIQFLGARDKVDQGDGPGVEGQPGGDQVGGQQPESIEEMAVAAGHHVEDPGDGQQPKDPWDDPQAMMADMPEAEPVAHSPHGAKG